MRIVVDRFHSTSEATASRVRIGGARVCYGLEDEAREVKVAGETRIPAGVYKVGVRKEGGFHNRCSVDRRTKAFHRGMLHILDVPGFEYVLIHIGNTEGDTAGCLLVGATLDFARMFVGNSAVAYEDLYKRVIGAAETGTLDIEFQDNDQK